MKPAVVTVFFLSCEFVGRQNVDRFSVSDWGVALLLTLSFLINL